MTADDPYRAIDPGNMSNHDKVCCSFCGSLVLSRMWDDHVDWHRTLEIQAGAVIRHSLLKIEENLEGS